MPRPRLKPEKRRSARRRQGLGTIRMALRPFPRSLSPSQNPSLSPSPNPSRSPSRSRTPPRKAKPVTRRNRRRQMPPRPRNRAEKQPARAEPAGRSRPASLRSSGCANGWARPGAPSFIGLTAFFAAGRKLTRPCLTTWRRSSSPPTWVSARLRICSMTSG
ncbi:hypothetical protein BMS3Abin13_01129 [bacterium BMS3Abin13]|nr:hypothetical protein BMS3Abin13_01129 [bacterium BMS3Abin13]